MDISKLIKFIIIILLISSCRRTRIYRSDIQHQKINIEEWNIKNNPIKNSILFCYKKNTNFKTLEKKSNLLRVIDNYNSYNATSLIFDSLPIIDLNKDYKLIINDTIIYKLKNIKTTYKIVKEGPNRVDSLYNMIKSININDKEHQYNEPRVFFIPKNTYIIEK